jgi:hypothetical protein
VKAVGAPLGLLAVESDRSLVVVASDGELAVGIRDGVDRARVMVKDARPEEATAVIASCRPWPWMVVGSGPGLPRGLARVLTFHPVVTLWLGVEPSGLPAQHHGFAHFAPLLAEIRRAACAAVDGMRLAPGAGVELPGGGISGNAELQALISVRPGGFGLPLQAFRSADRVLSRRGISLRPRRDPVTGVVSLR